MYKIITSPSAKRQLKKLKPILKDAIGFAIEDLKEYPVQGKKLQREFVGRFSYRIGVYRIIYKVDKKSKTVFILSAGHRSVVCHT